MKQALFNKKRNNIAKLIKWDIIDTTEAIVRVLDAKGLTIDSCTPFFDVSYIAKDNAVGECDEY